MSAFESPQSNPPQAVIRRRPSFRILASGLGLFVIGFGLILIFRPVPRLNVILITLDTTRADHIGCYGCSYARTPAIDALAQQGVLFERAYAPVPVTLPSHASMFTGLYPPEHGLRSNGRGRLGNSIPVLAEILQKKNYETGAFVASFVLHSKFGLNRGFQTYDDNFTDPSADESEHQRRDGRLVVDAALAWLNARKAKPFLCWVHLYDAHAYYDARPEEFGDEFKERPYDAGIAFADLQVQRIRQFVKDRRLERRTLILVVGDHGEGLMEHHEIQHGNQLYDSTMRVPLVFSGSPCVKPGIRVDVPVSLVDLTSTILDCLDVSPPNPITGRSLKNALAGASMEGDVCYVETQVPFLENRWAPLRGIVADRWKYIETTRSELYDLLNDSGETQNLAETRSETFHELQNRFEELVERMVPREAESVNLTANEQRMLESLGYLAGRNSTNKIDPSERLPDAKDMMPLFNDLMMARTLLRDGAKEDAVAKLQQILAKEPRYYQAQLVLGDALIADQRFAEAIAIYKAVAAERPDTGDAEGRWANALAAQGLFEDSIPHYHKVLEILPESSAYHDRLALAMVRLGRIRNAVSEFEKAIQYNDQNLNAHMELGNLLLQNGRFKQAIPHFEAVLKIRPSQMFARLNLASALAQERNFADAVPHATRATEDAPESFEARFTLGAILLAQNRYSEATVQLKEATRLRPDDVAARTQLQRAQAALDLQRSTAKPGGLK